MDDARPLRLPPWLKAGPAARGAVHRMKARLRARGLHTVCESARCPNVGACFAAPTATFLLLGDRCARGCAFCAVTPGAASPPDPEEPGNVARAAKDLALVHVVLTSVTRDDLADGGAAHFAATVRAVRAALPEATVEVLVPDFRGDPEAARVVLGARPDVFNHNVETVPRLYPAIRPGADFARSVGLLATAKRLAPGALTKSGLMVGLGETPEEVRAVMARLRDASCDILTIGQYLRPTRRSAAVARYAPPEEFAGWEAEGRAMGFAEVFAGPLVRSSYSAAEAYARARAGKETG